MRGRVWRRAYLFRGGLVFKAHRLLYHSTLGLRAITKKEKVASGAECTCERTVIISIIFVY